MQSKILSTLILISLFTSAQAQSLLNSSYDISRELFAKYNVLFQEYYQETTGDSVEIKQSHAGSSKQANAILHGLRADVVTFNQVTDVDVLADKGNLIPKDWASRLPNNSSPYYSTIAFLVHKDNPKNIHNWNDLIQSDVSLVFPNPKTSGNGRYTYLAALGYVQDAFANDSGKQDAFMKNLLSHVAVFDVGGRGATTSFVERNQGDVLITFESEVNNIKAQYPDQHFEVIVPPVSILAEFPVTWIDKNTARNGSTELAKSYLNYLYSEPAQQLLASFNYRVHNKDVAAKYREKFPEIKLKTIEDIGGSWKNVMQSQFGHDGKLDQLLRPE